MHFSLAAASVSAFCSTSPTMLCTPKRTRANDTTSCGAPATPPTYTPCGRLPRLLRCASITPSTTTTVAAAAALRGRAAAAASAAAAGAPGAGARLRASTGPTSVKRYSSLRVVGMRRVDSAARQLDCSAASLL